MIVVRDATPSDVPAIARVHVESRRRALAGVLPPAVADAWTVEERVATWAGVLADPALGTRAFARVAVAGDDVVGLGNAGALPVAEPGFLGEVARLYVAPAWQRRGVGRALFLSLAAGLGEAGLAPFLLWTVARNAPARAFYERMGGRPVGTVTVPSRGGALVEKVSYGWDRAPARRPGGRRGPRAPREPRAPGGRSQDGAPARARRTRRTYDPPPSPMSDPDSPLPPAPPPAPPPRTDGIVLSLLLAILVVVGGAAWLFDRRLRTIEERSAGAAPAPAAARPAPPGEGDARTGEARDLPPEPRAPREVTLASLAETLQQLNDDTYQYYVDSSQDLHELKRLVKQIQSVVRSMRPAEPGFAYGSWTLPELGRRPTEAVLAKLRADAESFGIRVEPGRVEVPGFLNLAPNRAMPIEYFVSRWPVLGHETLVHVHGNAKLGELTEERLTGLPTAVYKALLAAGFEQGEGSRMEEDADGKPKWLPPTGDKVYLGFRYRTGGTTHLARATDWVVDPSTGSVLPEDALRFTGSRRMDDPETGDEELSAEVSGLVVSVYYNPSTLVEIAVESNLKNTYEYNYARIPRPQGDEPILLDVVFSKTPIVPEGDGAKPLEKPVVVPPEGLDPGTKPEGAPPPRDPAAEPK